MIKNISNSVEQYDWVELVPDSSEDYLPPDYYDEILKDYSFGGKSDLELLAAYVSKFSEGGVILELGCGSGRSTEVILAESDDPNRLDLVDLSKDMAAYSRSKHEGQEAVHVFQSDSVDFLGNTALQYTSAISMWNLSHSVHQHMFRLEREEGSRYVDSVLHKFIAESLQPGGSMYLIHYDIQSPEQRLINPWRLKLWEEADPNFDASGQSPSKELLDSTFAKLKSVGLIDYALTHLIGDPIEYASPDEALETFLNFHMEGHFNKLPEFPQVVSSLLDGFKAYTDVDNVIRIAPGAFMYEVTRSKD